MQVHIARDNQQLGIYEASAINEALADGSLLPTDLAWSDGMSDWIPLAEYPGVQPVPIEHPTDRKQEKVTELVSCPECNQSIERTASVCPKCGYPFDSTIQARPSTYGPAADAIAPPIVSELNKKFGKKELAGLLGLCFVILVLWGGWKMLSWTYEKLTGGNSAQTVETSQPAPAPQQSAVDPSEAIKNAIDVSVQVETTPETHRYDGDGTDHVGLEMTSDYIIISSKVDHITIQNVKVNRGNCNINPYPGNWPDPVPKDLAFGENFKIDMRSCDVIEASVITNLGTWQGSFK